MLRVIICILFFITAGEASFCQEKNSIMIYTSDEKFLVPLIVQYLEELEIDGRQAFTTITNLNEVSASIKSEVVLREIIRHFSNKNYPLTKEVETYQQRVAQQLRKHDFFLNIYINRINTVLEYQFYLYDSKSLTNGASDPLPQNDIVKPLYSTSFIVDINNANYADILQLEIKKLFKGANQLPHAEISNDGEQKKEIYAALNDTVTLNGNASYDPDPVGEQLKHMWRMEIWNQAGQRIYNYGLADHDGSCSFVPSVTGTYRVFLIVYDGIDFSEEDSMDVIVQKKVEIYIPHKNVVTLSQNFLWQRKRLYSPVTFTIYFSSPAIRDSISIYTVNHRLRYDTLRMVKQYYDQEQAPHSFAVKKRVLRTLPDLLGKSFNDSFNVATTYLGFSISFNVPEDEEVDEEYSVGIKRNHLNSNTENISIKHFTYSWASLYVGYQSNWFSFNDYKDSSRLGSLSNNELKLGASGRLLYLGNFADLTPAWLEGQATVGIPTSSLKDSNHVSVPFQLSLFLGISDDRKLFYIGPTLLFAQFTFIDEESYRKIPYKMIRMLPALAWACEMQPFKKVPFFLNAQIGGSPAMKIPVSSKVNEKVTAFYGHLGARLNLFK